MGIFVTATIGAGALFLWRRGAGIDRFLVGWLLIEVAGFFALSPFMAGRRILPLSAVLALCVGRMVAAPAPAFATRTAPRAIAAWGVALALLYCLTDASDARTRTRVVAQTRDALETAGADLARENVWFLGHWGFQFYAERAGMRPLVSGERGLRGGDWVVEPRGVHKQVVELDGAIDLEVVSDFGATNPWPWSTLPTLYSGPVPLRRQPERQIEVRILRARPPS